MKKLIIFLMFFVCTVLAKDFQVEVCNNTNCYTYFIKDVKNYSYIHDTNGRKYLRIIKLNNKLLDIYVDSMNVKIKK